MVRSANERSSSFWIGAGIWATIVAILVSIELGVIAFVFSFILAIWVFGLRDKFDGETTASAYSVFNKGGKSLPGSLSMQDVDQQLRAGGFANQNDDTNDDGVPKGPAESKVSGSIFKGFSSNQNPDERARRRRAAADAALKRRTMDGS